MKTMTKKPFLLRMQTEKQKKNKAAKNKKQVFVNLPKTSAKNSTKFSKILAAVNLQPLKDSTLTIETALGFTDKYTIFITGVCMTV